MHVILKNIAYAARVLLRDRAFALAALITLSLGIGATTTIFTVVYGVLLKPLHYPEPARIVMLSGGATLAHFEELRKGSYSYTDVGAFSVGMENITFSEGTRPEVLKGARVSANSFSILGIKPLFGRSFLPEEDKSGGTAVALISSELWQRRFEGDPRIVGKTATFSAAPHTIIGVLPPGLDFPFPGVDVWVAKPSEMSTLPRRSQLLSPILGVFARLKPHVDTDQATAELDVLNRQYAAAYPRMLDAKPNSKARVKPLKDELVSNVRSKLWMLLGAVSFVMLIACGNVASLLLARAASREREFAVRAAIGAGRGRIIGQLLTESLLLAFVAGVLGVLLAKVSLNGIASMTAIDLPRAGDVRLDAVVLIFAVALSAATSLFFGLAPALSASRTDLRTFLRGSGETNTMGTKPGRWALRNILVVGQVAFSIILLIGATLLIESVARLRSVNPGFEAAGLLTMKVSLPSARYDTKQKKALFFNELVSSIGTIPGVQSAAAALTLPMTGFAGSPVQIVERPAMNFNERPIAVVEMITPAYFRTLKIALKRGREFSDRDKADAEPVAIINESLAKHFWPAVPGGQAAIGQHINIGSEPRASVIVGIAADVRQSGLDVAPRPGVFTPLDQNAPQAAMLAIRTHGNPLQFVNAVHSKVLAIDRNEPLSQVKTMDDIVEASQGQRRLMMVLLGAFAGAAVLLAMIGIYGVIAYLVVRRTQEFGIRCALGAQSSDILSLVVAGGLRLTLAGVVLGVAGALALTRLLKGLLFQVTATDPATFVGVSLVFILMAFAASCIPAIRATRVDPLIALRYE